jgi:phosphomannomutase/phosphoglucomutase
LPALSQLYAYQNPFLFEQLKIKEADKLSALITPEIRRDCPDEVKFHVVERLKARLKAHYPIIDLDGVRLLHLRGGLVRASNTQPALVLRFEANTLEALRAIQDLVEAHLQEELAIKPL